MACPRWARRIVCWFVGHQLPHRPRLGRAGICPRCGARVFVDVDGLGGVWAFKDRR